MTDDNNELTQAELEKLAAATQTEPPPHMVARWHDAIDRAAEQEAIAARHKPQAFSPSSFFWGAAITAAVAFGIAIGVFIGNDEPAMTPTYATVEPATAGRAALSIFARSAGALCTEQTGPHAAGRNRQRRTRRTGHEHRATEPTVCTHGTTKRLRGSCARAASVRTRVAAPVCRRHHARRSRATYVRSSPSNSTSC